MVVSFDPSTTVILSRDPAEAECEVCSDDGTTRDCSPTEKTVTKAENLPLEFSCLKPQDVFTVKIMKKIGETCLNFICKQNLRFGLY